MQVRDIGRLDPLACVEALADLGRLTFLDSAQRHERLGRYSFVAADPFGSLTVRDGVAFWNAEPLPGEPVRVLQELLSRFRQASRPDLPPFQGGAAGFLAYEFGRVLERLPAPERDIACPQAVLHFYDVVLAFDHARERGWLVSTGWPDPDGPARERRAQARADAFLARLEHPRPRGALRPASRLRWSATTSRADYERAVRHVVERILAGDIFQANIAQRFTADLPDGFDPWSFYRDLRSRNPAPFGAYLGFDELTIASSSPERFLELAAGRVETRPIKGTMRRSPDPGEDRALAEALLASEKDRAENVMIVDLLRNDLSRVCRPHTVRVPALCGLESYASVHHLVSVVEGVLAQDRTAVDLLAACFPGGSITGAPKIRAMEIITEVERRARNVYCGAIGYLGFDGSLDTSIAIRTVMLQDKIAIVHAGGGITALSDPAAEYDETLVKAQRIFEAFG